MMMCILRMMQQFRFILFRHAFIFSCARCITSGIPVNCSVHIKRICSRIIILCLSSLTTALFPQHSHLKTNPAPQPELKPLNNTKEHPPILLLFRFRRLELIGFYPSAREPLRQKQVSATHVQLRASHFHPHPSANTPHLQRLQKTQKISKVSAFERCPQTNSCSVAGFHALDAHVTLFLSQIRALEERGRGCVSHPNLANSAHASNDKSTIGSARYLLQQRQTAAGARQAARTDPDKLFARHTDAAVRRSVCCLLL
jgi:hypothetical protein